MLKGMREALIDIFNLFYKVIYGYARWVPAVAIVIIRAQVFCRNILRTNIHWNQEVALLPTTWMVFLGITVGTEKNLHIDAELLYDRLPVKIRNVMDVLDRTIILLVGAFFTVYGARMVLFTMDSQPPVTERPSSLMYIMTPASGIAIIYFTILNIMGLKEYEKTDNAGKLNKEEGEKE